MPPPRAEATPPARPDHTSRTPTYPAPAPQTLVPGRPPPAGPPPVRFVHDDGHRSWWQSRSASVAAGVILVLALSAVAAVLLFRDDGTSSSVAIDLRNARSAVDDGVAPVASAPKLRQIREAGRNADKQVGRLNGPAANLQNLDNRQLGEPAADLVAKEAAYLKALAQLDRVTYSVVGESGLKRWHSYRDRIDDAQTKLVSAGAAVQALSLDAPAGSLTIAEADLVNALGRVTRTVESGNRAILKYERDSRNFKRAVRKAERNAGAAKSYRASVVATLNRYQADRDDVTEWARTADSITRSDIRAAHLKVDGFISDRSRTIQSLSAMLGSAPDRVHGEHQALGTPLSASLDGLGAANAAIMSYANDPTIHSVTDAPEWQTFLDASDDAESNLANARGLWTNAIEREIARVRVIGVPDKPTKPQL